MQPIEESFCVFSKITEKKRRSNTNKLQAINLNFKSIKINLKKVLVLI